MFGLGTTELIIVCVVILVLFGAKRLPDSARALGRSMRILKAETKGLREDDPPATTTTVTDAGLQAHPLPPVQPVTPPAPEQPHQRSA